MRLLSALLTTLAATTTHAIDAPIPPLSGEARLAWLQSNGSSEKETFNGFVQGKYTHNDWSHEAKAEGLNESDSISRSSERYLAQAKSSWTFNPKNYLFIKLQGEKDQQSSYDYQAFLVAGYGRQFISTDTLKLSMEAGVGLRHNKDDITGVETNEALSNLAGDFSWKFRPGAEFKEEISIEAGEDSTVFRTRSAIAVDLTDVINLTVAYETKRDDGPTNIDDSLMSVGLGYKF